MPPATAPPLSIWCSPRRTSRRAGQTRISEADRAVDAVVLAGGGIERDRFLGLDPGIERKAQIPLLGRPMVEWTLRGLRSCRDVRRVVVVGHPSLATRELEVLEAPVLPDRGDIALNLGAGLEALAGSDSGRLLGVSGDLPLVTAAALDDLFTRASAADVVFPYVERADILRAYPDREWIFARTPEGAFTGCSAFLFRPRVLLDNWKWVEALLEARRKKPLALAAMFGLPFAVKLVFRRLRVSEVEQKLSSLLHLQGRGYRTPFPELAMDVDKYTDIALVETILRERP